MDINRLKELADRSYNSGMYTFTDFVDMAQLSEYYEHEKELSYAHPEAFGGYELAERKVIRFGNEESLGYSQDYPVTALSILPVNKKFSDKLSHRDFLGALMNLGIKRELLGDIFVRDNEAYVFCLDSIAEYIISNLSRVKHTTVKVQVCQDVSSISTPKTEDKLIQVSSVRADAVIARVYNLSRQEAYALFPEGLVYINGRLTTENAKGLTAGDQISVRGKGKFRFETEGGLSRKGKINCQISIYI